MEKDVEEKLRAKFALIDRMDPTAIQAAQQVYIMLLFYCLFFCLIKYYEKDLFQLLNGKERDKTFCVKMQNNYYLIYTCQCFSDKH